MIDTDNLREQWAEYAHRLAETMLVTERRKKLLQSESREFIMSRDEMENWGGEDRISQAINKPLARVIVAAWSKHHHQWVIWG